MKNLKVYVIALLSLCAIVISCKEKKEEKPEETTVTEVEETTPQTFITLLGKTYTPSTPSEEALKAHVDAKAALEEENSITNYIKLGRATTGLDQYPETIEVYDEGLAKYPDDARLLRHRGHRYISVRQFDKAIADLTKAASLVEGKEDVNEITAEPNESPDSYGSLYAGIYYHLGVAYYMKKDFKNSFEAFKKCREGRPNDENYVACSNWMYMSARRMNDKASEKIALEGIKEGMKVEANKKYYEFCKMYKGMPVPDDLLKDGEQMHKDAVMYAAANKSIYEGKLEEAKKQLEEMLKDRVEASFGYMAAETDYANLFPNEKTE